MLSRTFKGTGSQRPLASTDGRPRVDLTECYGKGSSAAEHRRNPTGAAQLTPAGGAEVPQLGSGGASFRPFLTGAYILCASFLLEAL